MIGKIAFRGCARTARTSSNPSRTGIDQFVNRQVYIRRVQMSQRIPAVDCGHDVIEPHTDQHAADDFAHAIGIFFKHNFHGDSKRVRDRGVSRGLFLRKGTPPSPQRKNWGTVWSSMRSPYSPLTVSEEAASLIVTDWSVQFIGHSGIRHSTLAGENS